MDEIAVQQGNSESAEMNDSVAKFNRQLFWNWFDKEAFPLLAIRAASFRKIFEYLDRFDTPVNIVETGCLRRDGDFAGDGQSTLLFDRYTSFRGDDSRVFSVDLNPEAVAMCRSAVSSAVDVQAGDSVQFLARLSERFRKEGAEIHLLYLDSFDLDLENWVPAAAHHIKELAAIRPVISPFTLVVVDDCAQSASLFQDQDGSFTIIGTPTVSGKGRLVSEFADQVGATSFFRHYQCAWIGM